MVRVERSRYKQEPPWLCLQPEVTAIPHPYPTRNQSNWFAAHRRFYATNLTPPSAQAIEDGLV
jgi:hypothetical protein